MNENGGRQKTPAWVLAIILAHAAVEPLTHLWIARADAPDRAFTGLHTTDSAIYLQSMRMFPSGFHSPYATCRAESPNNPAYFPAPFHWMYGILGVVADGIGADRFQFLGIVNGLGLAAYLFAVFRFLCAAFHLHARLAFIVYTCTAGLGGIAYLLARLTGLDHAANFETYFQRFAMYELVEGPYLFPWLYGARLYYTLSLALCFAALTAYVEAVRMRCGAHHVYAGLLLFAGTLINFRFGIMTFGLVVLLQLVAGHRASVRQNWPMGIAVGFGTALSYMFMARNPNFISNTGDLVRESMWLSPFITTTAFHLALLPLALFPNLRALRGLPRALGLLGLAYLLAFTLLFIGYQLYYGNVLVARDFLAATRISDWALAVAVLACAPILVLYWHTFRADETQEEFGPRIAGAWITLWFLGYLAIAVSAFGQGWFIRFTPQRFMVFLGVPLSVLVAQAIAVLRLRNAKLSRAALTVLIVAGIASIASAALFFQGPLIREPGASPFAHLHAEYMTNADVELLDTIPGGTVLAPKPMADAVAVRAGLSTLGGAGGADLSDQRSVDLQPQIDAFFRAGEPADERAAFAERWCIDYIFCPDTWPVDTDTLSQLDAAPVFVRIATAGRGAVYRVVVVTE